MNRSQSSFKSRKLPVFAAVGSLFFILVAFQNCGKPANIAALTASASGEVFKIEATAFHNLEIPDNSRNRTLDLNSDTGVIQGSDGQQYCLSPADLGQLQTILGAYGVCQPKLKSADPNIVCTMIYRDPYAHLVSPAMDLALGEARNGCDVALDLCGDGANQLRVFVSSVISRIDGMQCK